MSPFPACIRAAAAIYALPPVFRSGHWIADIAKAWELGYQTSAFNKRQAARDAILGGYDLAVNDGNGNRAAKRAAQIETANWFDEVEREFEAQNPDAFAKHYAQELGINYHDL